LITVKYDPFLTLIENVFIKFEVFFLVGWCFDWQGLCLRVVGVGDSKSLVVVDDLLNKGLDDSFLLELCRLKNGGESLSKLGDFGRYLCQYD
jgi:hypothetical protein